MTHPMDDMLGISGQTVAEATTWLGIICLLLALIALEQKYPSPVGMLIRKWFKAEKES